MRTPPVAVYSTFGEIALESATIVIEDRKLVLGQDVGVWIGVDVGPDILNGGVEVGSDTWIKVAFGIASYVDGSLIVEGTYAVNVGGVVATHDARGSRDGGSVGVQVFVGGG